MARDKRSALNMTAKSQVAPSTKISHRIVLIRGQRVMIDADLAELYGVPTKVLNQAVKRNLARFPDDFMFKLTLEEKNEVVTNCDHLVQLKFSSTPPFAFTEHGAIQAANVLNSAEAINMGVYVVRAFVQLREILANHRELAGRLNALEEKAEGLAMKQDVFARNTRAQLKQMFDAIRELMAPPEPTKRPIGFVHAEEKPKSAKGRGK